MIKVATDIKHFIVIVYTNAVLNVTNVCLYILNQQWSVHKPQLYLYFFFDFCDSVSLSCTGYPLTGFFSFVI